jgi:hypothetical protein
VSARDPFQTCNCEDAEADYCPVHAPDVERDTIPAPPPGDDDPDSDRHVVPQDLLQRWLASPEPRIPWEVFVAMFADTGEDTPTNPDCPLAKRGDD